MSITKSTLIGRINRRLAKDGLRLRSIRGERAQFDLGEHIVIDVSMNFPIETHVDLVALADEIGCRLAPHEREVRQC